MFGNKNFYNNSATVTTATAIKDDGRLLTESQLFAMDCGTSFDPTYLPTKQSIPNTTFK